MSIRWLWILFLKATGWNAKVTFPTYLSKAVILVGPHTSSWDFIYGLAYRSVMQIGFSKFLGKKELFKPPFGFIFHWLGGTPVDRFSKQNLVDQVVDKFNSHTKFLVAMSPEGTRKKVDKLKTGFYNIAKLAKVPIVMTGIDFYNKTLVVSEPFWPTDNFENDLTEILNFYRKIQGKIPANGLSHL